MTMSNRVVVSIAVSWPWLIITAAQTDPLASYRANSCCLLSSSRRAVFWISNSQLGYGDLL